MLHLSIPCEDVKALIFKLTWRGYNKHILNNLQALSVNLNPDIL